MKQSVGDVVQVVDLGGIEGREASLGPRDSGGSILKEEFALKGSTFGPVKRRIHFMAG